MCNVCVAYLRERSVYMQPLCCISCCRDPREGPPLGRPQLALDPRDSTWQQFTLPGGITAPRRFDIDETGVAWIPLHAGNAIVRVDPRNGDVRLAYGASPGIPARIARLRRE